MNEQELNNFIEAVVFDDELIDEMLDRPDGNGASSPPWTNCAMATDLPPKGGPVEC